MRFRGTLIFGIFCLSFNGFSQKFTLGFIRENIAYIGIDNPISCTIERYPCESVVLSVGNGSIEKIGNCSFIYRPVKVEDGKVSVYIVQKGKRKKIGETYVRARNLSDPIAYVGHMKGGSMSLGAFKAQGGVSAAIQGFFEVQYTVKSFVITAYRNKEILFHTSSDGNHFTEEIRNSFNVLQIGDVVLFSSIKVRTPDYSEVLVKPIEFSMK